MQPSSGNVFADLGFEDGESQRLEVCSDLMIEATRLIEAQGLDPAAAARLLGEAPSRVSDLMRGEIHRFTIESLIAMLARAGATVATAVLEPRVT